MRRAVRRRHLAWELRDVEGPRAGQFRLGPPRSAEQDPLSHREKLFGAVGGLYVDPSLPSLLCFIRRGVVVKTQTRWTGLISGEVLVAADDLPTDLSGFSVREGSLLADRRTWAENFARRIRSGFVRAYPNKILEQALTQAAARSRLAERA